MTAFELSRIRGQGWKAAKAMLAAAQGEVDPAEAEARNPHRTAEKRAQWTMGFVEALGSAAPALTKRGGNGWRPAPVK